MNPTTTDPDRTDWRIAYDDVEPIRLRDPVAEVLGVLEPGAPFVVHYRDVVTAAGHSCPTAAGAFRLVQVGLDALYPDELPVRGDIAVRAGGAADAPAYGVTARLVSYVTGAAGEDGFAGLVGGFGGRQGLLTYDDLDADGVAFAFERTDTGDAVVVTFHVGELPGLGPGAGLLPKLVDGTATAAERATFEEDWHGRVRRVLTDSALFTVEPAEAAVDP